MCRRLDSIRAVDEAAERLTVACRSHVAAQRRVGEAADEQPIAKILNDTFRAASVTPTDMLHKLGKLK